MAKPDYTLTFVADHKGQLVVHADAKGLGVLISSLERLKKKAEAGECDHDHLFTDAWAGDELSETLGCEKDGALIHHVKLYGWTEEWAKKYGFIGEKPSKPPQPTFTSVRPYLIFGGCCEEALEFYRAALGAQVEYLLRYKDSPEPLPPGMVPPGFEDKVLHATFRLGENTFMAADGSEAGLGFNGFLLSVVLPTAAEADRAFAALSAGGRVKMPLAKTFWAPRYGVLTDRFGLGWKISVEA